MKRAPVTALTALRTAGGRLGRVARCALADSLYLVTGPIFAVASVLLTLVGPLVARLPDSWSGLATRRTRSPISVRTAGDLEWWRLTVLRRVTQRAPVSYGRVRPSPGAGSLDVGVRLDALFVAASIPLAIVSSTVTAMWWFVGVGGGTSALRGQVESAEVLRPLTFGVGDTQSHVYVSLGLTSPASRLAFGTVLGVLLLVTVPFVARGWVAVHARIAASLLSEDSPFLRGISGLQRERDDALAQSAAAMSAEAEALRRLERDIHDGPQQRLVRLGMELGRAQHLLEKSPEVAREALADAVLQTQEALNELRALSRGIAPPILVDRGLREALADLGSRSTTPAGLDVEVLATRPSAAIETAAYFVVAEALTNVAKHSYAAHCEVGLRHEGEILKAWVTDDGIGGASLQKGHGLRGLDDRLTAVGGRLVVESPEGGPTTVLAELPWA